MDKKSAYKVRDAVKAAGNPWFELDCSRHGFWDTVFDFAQCMPMVTEVEVCPAHGDKAWYRPTVGAWVVPSNTHRCIFTAGKWLDCGDTAGRTPEWD